MHKILTDKRGVAALMTVIIVLAVLLSTGLAVSAFSVNSIALDLESDQSHQAIQIGDACADEVVFRVKRNLSYNGGSLSFPEGNCVMTVSGTGASRTANIVSTVGNSSRNILINMSILSNVSGTATGVSITNWQEN